MRTSTGTPRETRPGGRPISRIPRFMTFDETFKGKRPRKAARGDAGRRVRRLASTESSCFGRTPEWNKKSSSELWVKKSGGAHGSDNALPEMWKTKGSGYHHLWSYGLAMYQLRRPRSEMGRKSAYRPYR
jgi:hypothetical protein